MNIKLQIRVINRHIISNIMDRCDRCEYMMLKMRVINRHIISYIIVRLLHNSIILCALNLCMSCLTLYLVDWYEIVSLCVHRNFILPYSHRCSWLSIILFAWVKITYSIMSSDSDICCPLPWDNNTCIYIATEWK